MNLFLLNFYHDEALASNSPFYYPCKIARDLSEQLYDLPKLWYDGQAVYYKQGVKPNWPTICEIEVWGWDPLVCHRLRQIGAPESLLRTQEAIDNIRTLSSRQTAVALLRELRTPLADITFGESAFCRTTDEVQNYVKNYESVLYKAPWSCSGRGVFSFGLDRVRKIIREQGGIAVEPFFAHEQDFAMEFYCRADAVVYEGLSVFRTDAAGHYLGNLLDDQARLQTHLKVAPEHLTLVRKQLEKALEKLLIGKYIGPVGVDMMIARQKIHPCVEINLRNTMGRCALFIYKAKPRPGFFSLLNKNGQIFPSITPISSK